MKQKLALACALITEPQLLLLDEPTSGVDPISRREFWDTLASLSAEGMTIVVATPYLDEAEQCNRLGFMVAGELVAEGTPTGIKAEQEGHLIELITDAPQRAADLLKTESERWRVSLFGDRLHVIVDDDEAIRHMRAQLEANGIRVVTAAEQRYSLEDVFIVVVEKARRKGKVAVEE